MTVIRHFSPCFSKEIKTIFLKSSGKCPLGNDKTNVKGSDSKHVLSLIRVSGIKA